jgi:osmoprotectant transport system permease protein
MRIAIVVLLLLFASPAAAAPLRVGSKRFTESYILAEIVAQRAGGVHEQGLGGTAVTFRALEDGAID